MNQKTQKKILREFGIVFGLFFPIIFGIVVPLIYGHPFRSWTFFIGLLFLIMGFLKPNILFYPHMIWMKFGLILGWINSRLILGIIFIFVLQPISLIMKLFGYDPLRKKIFDVNTYRESKQNYKIDLNRIF